MERRESERLAELDGLRGIAILLVMLVHFTNLDGRTAWDLPFQSLEAFGWIGVDLFFVLSGFLITGILLDGRGDPRGLLRFYGRRAVRILPVYYGLLLLYTFVLPALIPGGKGILPAVWVSDPAWYWTFLSNFLFVKLGAFPDEVMAVSWSLAIEEQFYFAWPFFVRETSEEALEKLCFWALGFCSVLRIALLLADWAPVPIYVFTPTRLDGLAAGALIALWRRSPEGLAKLKRWRGPAVKYGLAVLLACLLADAWLYRNLTWERWLVVFSFPALAVFFGGVLAFSLDSPWRSSKLLTNRYLGRLGLWSFPIYLLNNALAEGARRSGFDPNQLTSVPARWAGQLAFYVAVGGVCVAAGALLHYGVERPAQRLKRWLPRPRALWRLEPS